jgi:hypothetical protein
MKPWKLIVLSLLITLTIGGVYLFSVWKHRQDPGVISRAAVNSPIDRDELTEVRTLMPADFKDVEKLQGTTVWMKNGYAIPYFSYAAGHIDFAHRVGVLPGAERLKIKKIIKAAAPSDVDDGMSHGSRQAFAIFTLPTGTDLYAMPIGVADESHEAYFVDVLFYYDDPHSIYDWPPEVWSAVDAHRGVTGMSETAAHLALGRIIHTDGGDKGNRTVTYDQGAKQWTVTFVDDRATQVKAT